MLKKVIITFILLVVAAFLFWSSVSVQRIFYEAVFSVEQYSMQNEYLVMAVFIALAALSALLSPFSSAPFVPIGVILWGNLATSIFLFFGWIIGEIAAYFIGYYLGYPLVSQIISSEKIAYFKNKIPKGSEFLLVLLFRFSMPAEIPGYVLGIAKYNFWKYLLATALAELPFALITGYAGGALIDNEPVLFLGLIAFGFLTISSMFYVFNKKLTHQQ
jgi:uncharacterized membrane protein YdjX (TVP38/TMEM64 family)